MKIEAITVGQLATNCYILHDEKEGIIIDPGDDGEKICSFVKELRIQIISIVLTHSHFDHIGAVDYVSSNLGCKLVMSREDYADYQNPPSVFSFAKKQKTPADTLLCNGDTVKVGKFSLSVLSTPGHTIGSITLIGDGFAFCGDTLFYESIGRTDFPGGDFKREMVSVQQILQLPDETVLYSGHGSSTTVGHEKKYNPYVGMML